MLRHVVELVQNFLKVGGAVEVDVLQSFLIMPEYLLNAVDARIEDVTVESEAVRDSFRVWRNAATKTIQIDVLAAVVKLKDISDRGDRLNVLVFCLI